MTEELIGMVTHYFGKAHVAGIEVTDGALHLGDTIHVLGHTSDFIQRIESMQIDRHPVDEARPGDVIGIRVAEHAREHDKVFRVVSD